MTNFRDHWLKLEVGLTDLLETLKPSLDEGTIVLVQKFIDNNEFGVALEWLNSVALERNIGLSTQQSQKFRELAKLMEIELPG
jgi:hypothetical protein